MMPDDFASLPIIDVAPLATDGVEKQRTAAKINAACRQSGFFYAVGHGVDAGLQQRLQELSREFFALPTAEKMRIEMSRGGKAWRGFFRVGDELTSGRPDQKEGLYFGTEFADDHPLVQAGTPLHGPNLFPEAPVDLRETVLEYMAALTELGQRLMGGIALGLGLPESYFADHGTRDPLTLFRIFNYPPPPSPELWGVGEHTDYGLLTILLQDDVGGLEVKSKSDWVSAPPLPGSFVCNIGDMLDRMTRGVYRSTPHRVRNRLRARSHVVSVLLRPQLLRRCASRSTFPRAKRLLTIAAAVGISRACIFFREPTATICWARWERCFRD